MATEIYLGRPPENIVNWIKAERKYQEMLKTPLTFTAEQAGAKLSLLSNNGPVVTLETSPTGEEGTWTPYKVGSEITLANVGDKVMFRNSSDTIQVMGTSPFNYNYFQINSGKIAASGNINTLLKADGSVLDLTGRNYCYNQMFYYCTSLTQAPELPATTLANYCYNQMFYNCTSLTQAPKLPATTLADWCYSCMFWDCTSLTQAPELPATTLANQCYDSMFGGCVSLTQASFPNLEKETVTTKVVKSQSTFVYVASDIETTCKDGILIINSTSV